MISITKKFEFESAHFLPDHPGKCRDLHGHRFQLEIEITGEINQDTGMITDFAIIKEIIQENVIDKFDHKLLNDIVPVIPTSENLVQMISTYLIHVFEVLGLALIRVRLYETSNSYAEWRNTNV